MHSKTGMFHAIVLLFGLMITAYSVTVTGEDSGNSTRICKDNLTNCEDYNKDVCSEFYDWAKLNCAKECGICKVPLPVCPDGWLHYEADKTCLKIIGLGATFLQQSWTRAGSMCRRSIGGDLVIVRDDTKAQFILSLFGVYSDMFWIGVEKVNSAFVYVDGSPLGSYKPWIPGNPDNLAGDENCVAVYPKGIYTGKWNDYSCEIRKPYICSKAANEEGVH